MTAAVTDTTPPFPGRPVDNREFRRFAAGLGIVYVVATLAIFAKLLVFPATAGSAPATAGAACIASDITAIHADPSGVADFAMGSGYLEFNPPPAGPRSIPQIFSRVDNGAGARVRETGGRAARSRRCRHPRILIHRRLTMFEFETSIARPSAYEPHLRAQRARSHGIGGLSPHAVSRFADGSGRSPTTAASGWCASWLPSAGCVATSTCSSNSRIASSPTWAWGVARSNTSFVAAAVPRDGNSLNRRTPAQRRRERLSA